MLTSGDAGAHTEHAAERLNIVTVEHACCQVVTVVVYFRVINTIFTAAAEARDFGTRVTY